MVDTSDTYEGICTFCKEASGERERNLFYDLDLASCRADYILHESAHHVVFPCIGALTDWYVLVVSREHVLSAGWLGTEQQDDMRSVIDQVRQQLVDISGLPVMVFEHGSFDFRDKGGACYDHAHVHVVATDRDPAAFVDAIPPPVTMATCEDWIDTATELIRERQCSYLALDDGTQQRVGVATGAPSQFFRRCLATWLGADHGEWDWLTFPQLDRVTRMMASPIRR